MQLWLERVDLDGHSYSVPSSQESTTSSDGAISRCDAAINTHLAAYTDALKESAVPCPVEAIEPLESLLTYYPNHEALLIRLTYLRYKGEARFSERRALNILNSILEMHPEHEAALKLLIDLHWKAGWFGRALPHLTQLIENEPGEMSPFLLHRRAEAYYALSRPLDALNDLERALSASVRADAVRQREARKSYENWENHRLFHKQPVYKPDCERYGVIEDEYTTYNMDATYEACVALMAQMARAGYAVLSDDACNDEQARKRTRVESPSTVLNV
ncbi:MAG: hypothetical protein P1U32_08720 [Legionellaceae bacterium]|nr:hypothetical protein [Legionellaceae bacterium]